MPVGLSLICGTGSTAEGIPLNMRMHGCGHGHLDLNFLIPELVATSRCRKGADFSSACSVDLGAGAGRSDTDSD
jgi:hypothetical protein